MNIEIDVLAVQVIWIRLVSGRPATVAAERRVPGFRVAGVTQCAVVLCAADDPPGVGITGATIKLRDPEIIVQLGPAVGLRYRINVSRSL
jgi:hypothetical protein